VSPIQGGGYVRKRRYTKTRGPGSSQLGTTFRMGGVEMVDSLGDEMIGGVNPGTFVKERRGEYGHPDARESSVRENGEPEWKKKKNKRKEGFGVLMKQLRDCPVEDKQTRKMNKSIGTRKWKGSGSKKNNHVGSECGNWP